MPSPLVVVVVVALSGADGQSTQTLGRAAQESLGPEAVVVTREEARVDDTRVVELGEELRADTLVVVTWEDDPAAPRAELRLYSRRTRAWTQRAVTFSRDDPHDERGKALGFDIASMVRTSAPSEPAPTPPAPPAPQVPPGPERPREPAAPPFSRFAVAAAAQGVAALGDAGTSVGGEGALAFRPTRTVAIGARVGLRVGDVPGAAASASYTRVGVGVAWAPIELRAAPVSIGGRVDVLAMRQSLSRSDGPSRDAQWLMGADVVGETTWSLSRRAAIFVAAGAELTFGASDVLVDGRGAATIAPVRALAELGGRVDLD